MPLWNESCDPGSGGITPAEVEAACTAAIAASGIPDASQVEDSCTAAIAAASGTTIPTTAQIQTGLATATSLADVKSVVDALPSAATIATAVGAQAACAAAITAAVGFDIPDLSQIQVACENALDGFGVAVNSSLQPAAAAAITAASLPTAAQNTTSIVTACVGASPLRTTVTISGAGTSGTLLAAPGVGIRNYITSMIISCSVAQSTWSLASTGVTSTGTHSLLQNSMGSWTAPAGTFIFQSGSNTAITLNKTTGATIIVNLIYYQA